MNAMYTFSLSEHIQSKESFVIMKKFDFRILTYLYILRSPKFIYGIFVAMYGWMCVCEWTLIDFGEGRKHRFFTRVQKKEFLLIITYGVNFFKVF